MASKSKIPEIPMDDPVAELKEIRRLVKDDNLQLSTFTEVAKAAKARRDAHRDELKALELQVNEGGSA